MPDRPPHSDKQPEVIDLSDADVDVVQDPGAPLAIEADGLFREAFERSDSIGALADAAGRVVSVTQGMALLAGGRDRVLGQPLWEAPWWEDPAALKAAVAQALSGTAVRFDARAVHAGQTQRLRLTLRALPRPEGPAWLSVEAVDVTALVEAERHEREGLAAARDEQARLRALLDASPALMGVVSTEWQVTAANAAWRRHLADATGQSVGEGDAFAPILAALPEGERTAWERALYGASEATFFSVPTAPGSWAEGTVTTVRTEHGTPMGAAVVGRMLPTEAAARAQAPVEGTATLTVDLDAMRLRPSDALCRLLHVEPVEDVAVADLLANVANADEVLGSIHEVISASDPRLEQTLIVEGEDGATTAVRLRARRIDTFPRRLVGVLTAAGAEQSASERLRDLKEGAWAGEATAPVAAPPSASRVRVEDPERIGALRQTGLLQHEPSPSFDQLTQIVSEALGVPVSLVSIVDADRQVFVGNTGLGGPVGEEGQTPLSHSFCQHVAAYRRPLVVPDASEAPIVRDNKAVDDLGVAAYLGVPIAAPDGHVVGSLCAIDNEPHEWTENDLRLLQHLAEMASAEVAAHQNRSSSP